MTVYYIFLIYIMNNIELMLLSKKGKPFLKKQTFTDKANYYSKSKPLQTKQTITQKANLYFSSLKLFS